MPYLKWIGQRLFYRERGEGDLLLVLPGNTASSACHGGELEYWSDRYHVTSLDYLGTGGSDRVPVWADDWYDQGAHQAAALVERLGRSTCLVMGTSGGAVVALLMAALYPGRVRAVIADSFGERYPQELVQTTLIENRAQRTPGQVGFWEAAHGDDWEQVVEADTEMLVRLARRGGDWFGSRLEQIRCPVLLTASREDELVPDAGPQMCRVAAQIADCRIYVNNSGGHPLMWSRPQDFRAISDHFMSTIEQ
ncbi:MAG: alpha/beta hydrolase [Anaerolineales bacterium]|nr:MAG: alpha/beta hydrolase [Anaerolineales bacterium]